MAQFNNLMEIFKLLNKSNCNLCNQKTCLAFAATVFKGQKSLAECPKLSSDIISQYEDPIKNNRPVRQDEDEAVEALKKRIAALDFSETAKRIGASYKPNKLTLKIMGKDFHIDGNGNPSSDIHINPWILMPVLLYSVESAGREPSGQWLSFRELKEGASRYGLFKQRCEKPLRALADTYPDLFEYLIRIFNGRQVENHYDSDIAMVLSPLPKLPILICYWKPDEGLQSSLNIFFDQSADDNLNIEAIFGLSAGMVNMFEKIARRHGDLVQ